MEYNRKLFVACIAIIYKKNCLYMGEVFVSKFATFLFWLRLVLGVGVKGGCMGGANGGRVCR